MNRPADNQQAQLLEEQRKLNFLKELLEKREVTQEGLKFTVKHTGNEELLLNLIRSLKGLIVLSLNIPNENVKNRIQEEVLTTVRTFTNKLMIFNNLDKNTAGGRSDVVYGFQIVYTKEGANAISITIHSQNREEISKVLLKILGIHGSVEESLMTESDALAQIESYKAYVERKLQELKEAKEEIESLIRGKSLDVFSKEFNKKAWWLWLQIIIFIIFITITSFLFYETYQAILHLFTIKDGNIHTLLIRSTITLVLGGISFYLLRYTIHLFEQKDEYRYKALVLSTFPALNYFLKDDKDKYELIKTIILENQRLQTLYSKEERLPLEEVAKLLSVLKDGK